MAREFATGVRFAQVPTLPAAASNPGVVLEQGGKLWFSDGAAWVDLGAAGGGGGGAVDWTVVTAGQPLADDAPLLAVIATTQTFPLPASPGVGDEFVVRNHSASTAGALVIVDPGAGRSITYGAGQSLAAAETLTCERGETIHLVCRNATTFELLTPGAVGPPGPQGPQGTQGPAGNDGWTYIRLATDFVTNTTASANVTGLSFAPAANRRIAVEGTLLLRTATAATGARPGIAWPTGTTDGSGYVDAPNSATALQFAVRPAGTAVRADATGLPNTTGSWLSNVVAYFITGASPSGNFQITLASETTGTNVTMRAGSFIRWREVP